jgi:hypothetical protein
VHYIFDNKNSIFVSFFSFITLSTFHIFFFFPSFPLNNLLASLSSFYSFPSSPLQFTLYHIYLQPTCFCLYSLPILLDTVLILGVTSDIFPELSNPAERVGTLPLRIQAFTKPLNTSAHYNKLNRTETYRNFGW